MRGYQASILDLQCYTYRSIYINGSAEWQTFPSAVLLPEKVHWLRRALQRSGYASDGMLRTPQSSVRICSNYGNLVCEEARVHSDEAKANPGAL